MRSYMIASGGRLLTTVAEVLGDDLPISSVGPPSALRSHT